MGITYNITIMQHWFHEETWWVPRCWWLRRWWPVKDNPLARIETGGNPLAFLLCCWSAFWFAAKTSSGLNRVYERVAPSCVSSEAGLSKSVGRQTPCWLQLMPRAYFTLCMSPFGGLCYCISSCILTKWPGHAVSEVAFINCTHWREKGLRPRLFGEEGLLH